MTEAGLDLGPMFAYPLMFWVLWAIGVFWGGATTYIMRLRGLSHENGGEQISKYFSVSAFIIELVVAGFAGFLGTIISVHFGLAPALIIGVAALCSFLNRSGLAFLVEAVPMLFEQHIVPRLFKKPQE